MPNEQDTNKASNSNYSPEADSTTANVLSLSPIAQQVSLATLSFDHIKAAIIVGDLKPGALYTVAQFADALGVSRTPVRDALLMLSQNGLLEVVKNRGFKLRTVSESELKEIFELRLMLEIPAMEMLAKKNPPPKNAFSAARELYLLLQSAADKSDVLEFLRLDRQFHLELTSALGNHQLTTLIGNLRDRVHLPGLRHLAESGRLHDSGVEHKDLLCALESGDSTAAARIMNIHLMRTQNEWKDAMPESSK